MMEKMIIKNLTVAVVLLVLSAAAFGFFAGAAGKYKGSVTLENFGVLPVTAEIKGADDKLTGIINSSQGDADIVSGSVKADKIVMQITIGDLAATINGTIDDKGKINGTIAGDQLNGTIELTPVGENKPNG